MTRGHSVGRTAPGTAAPLRPARRDDVVQLATAAAVNSALTALAYRRPTLGRRVMGLFFGVMGLGVNGVLTVAAPDQFPALARRAPWAWYRRIGVALTDPAPRAFGAAMAVGETALAAAVLGRGRAARLGLLAAAAFSVGITPLGVYTLANPVLAAGALHLARRQWPTAAFARAARGGVR